MFYALYCRAYQLFLKFAVLFLNWSPPELLQGPGSVKELPKLIKSHGLKKILVVTDQNLRKLGLLDALLTELDALGIAVAVYADTCANPTIENVEQARALYLSERCEGIIAFGGGSPMDCAKVTGARVVRPGKPVQKMRGLFGVLRKLPPLYAIPTTAGTGSEVTIAAVITDGETHEKFPINDPSLRPRCAVLDPELTVGLPPHITSTTGMDALTHAVEAFIGRSNTRRTEAWALSATEAVFAHIETVYADGKNLPAREAMLRAAFDAGLAFTRAYVGYVHAIAHALGGLYNVPHGLANAVILPHMLDYFGESAHKRLALLADAAGIAREERGDAEKANAFIAEMRAMNARMGIPAGFDCIREEDIPTIAARALREANPLYPVPKLMRAKDCEAFIAGLRTEKE
ncbi:MAG: iron-containing alcohol dehydrogenase [Oscillospiraceae bacterium]|nr:iron-containing alcohol dehydrogenase [Oscillospiraceae bacterium]